MIAFHDRAIQFANPFHTLVRVRIVADHIAKADKMRAIALARIGQNRFERLEVGVNVTKNCKTHDATLTTLQRKRFNASTIWRCHLICRGFADPAEFQVCSREISAE